MRIFFWASVLGIADEPTVLCDRFGEETALRHLRASLRDDVIAPSRTAVATADGMVAFQGGAATDASFRGAALARAVSVPDATTSAAGSTSIRLMVRGNAPHANVVAAKEAEQIEHRDRERANLVVAPRVLGGRLPIAVRHRAAPAFPDDSPSSGGGMDAAKQTAVSGETGCPGRDLPPLDGALVLGIVLGNDGYPFQRVGNEPSRASDRMVLAMVSPPSPVAPAPAR